MEEELRSYLEAMETRLHDQTERLETRLGEQTERLETRLREQTERVETRLREQIEKVETKLLTAFHQWASPLEMRIRSHSLAIRATDLEVEDLKERVEKLEKSG